MATATKHVLFVSSNEFYPPLTGSQRRTVQMFSAMRSLGYKLTVVSNREYWDANPVSRKGLTDLQEMGVDVRVEGCGPLTPGEEALMGRVYRFYGLLGQKPPEPLLYRLFRSEKKWVNAIVEEIKPDVIYCTYLDSDRYIDHKRLRHIRRVIDTVDLKTLNQKMWEALRPRLPYQPTDILSVDDEALQPEFLEKLALAPEPSEFEIYDNYDCTIAIVEREAEVFRRNVRRTEVVTIPVMNEVVDLENTYSGDPCMPSSDNPYNLQGVLFFARHVLPSVLRQEQDFCFHVAGPLCRLINPQPGLKLSDFADVKSLYTDAPFLLCPVFSGTGQQVKITEAMAYGVPVVAFRDAAERTGVRHGENGLVADTTEDFIEQTLQLWRDRDLCRKLGGQAREMVARNYSMDALVEMVKNVV